MKIFVDENIPSITVRELRAKGFEVIDIRGTQEQGITDEVLWQRVQKEKCLLITTDKGFSTYCDEAHCGILIIRHRQPSRIKIHQRVMQAITRYSEKQWPDRPYGCHARFCSKHMESPPKLNKLYLLAFNDLNVVSLSYLRLLCKQHKYDFFKAGRSKHIFPSEQPFQ